MPRILWALGLTLRAAHAGDVRAGALQPDGAPPPTLVYNHMPKAGGTTLVAVFQAVIPAEQLKIETEMETVENEKAGSFVVGSVREPCDYYLSLWAYGVSGEGRFHNSVTHKCGGNSELLYGVDPSPAASATFRQWLAVAVDSMGMRFNNSYPQRALVDCWVRTEFLDSDTMRCLEQYSARGGSVDWGAAAVELSPQKHAQRRQAQRPVRSSSVSKEGEEVNTSEHGECAEYYDDASAKRVLTGGDAFLGQAFGYGACCDAGVATTNTPSFTSDGSTWDSEQDEIDMMCGRIARIRGDK